MNQIYIVLLALSGIIILSHFIVIFSHKIRIPSVLLFILLGMLLQFFSHRFNINSDIFYHSLIFFGVLGLILIVFEGALELKISRQKIGLLGSAFGSALGVFLLSTAFLTLYFLKVYKAGLMAAFINAMPFSIISSAIAISSSLHFSANKKEFIIYESVLSDILGILIFTFFVTNHVSINSHTVISMLMKSVLVVVISWVASFALLFLFKRTHIKTKSIFILAILVSAYSIGKMFHLPALILVLCFGLFVSNYVFFLKSIRVNTELRGEFDNEIKQFKGVILEATFLIRSYFFILLGFSIKLISLLDLTTIVCGLGIVAIIFIIRYIYFKLFMGDRILGEFFIAPRGLVTVLLFFTIPLNFRLEMVNEGTLSFVIILTNLLMIFGTRGKDIENEVI